MLESKYLARFERLRKEGADLVTLRGDRILVELMPKEELRSKGGLFLPTSDDQRSETKENQATIGIVLYTGRGYYNEETGADVPMDTKPGDLVLISAFGLKYYSTFPGIPEYTANTIAISRESEVHMVISGVQAFEKVKELLGS